MNAVDLCYTPATELGRLIRARQLSPVELTEAVLSRIERLNPRLQAFLTVTADHARDLAGAAESRAMQGCLLGSLDGIPYSLKDLEATAGIRTTLGSRFFEDHVPTQDSVLAGRLRASGAVLLGKTNTPHIGYKDMTDNLLGPPCRNPWDLARTAGGSSGGAGAAVAAGLGPLAHGSDGAGSIRIPAALCGIFGLKPSFGRIPSWPSADLWAARSHPGPMARTVRDAALLLQVMAGPDLRDPLSIDAPPPDFLTACDGDLSGLRIGWSPDLGFAAVDPEVATLTHQAASRFRDLGCEVEEAKIDWGNPSEFHRVIYSVQHAARLGDRALARPDWIEPTLMARLARILRSGLLEVLQEDYIRTARAKGLAELHVLLRHGLRGACIPLLTVAGLTYGSILGGTVITESVFAWPGIGRLALEAVYNRDFPLVQAIVLVAASIFIVINLLVDVAYGWLDPRIRLR
jgi:Asp-tRNA(Asn)/Glu-tRNA(Gln) amidotransferase A subunit family amidase